LSTPLIFARQQTKLKANRGKYSDSDLVDIVVSENVAIFRSVGTESEARQLRAKA
jgi:hypothetical protein